MTTKLAPERDLVKPAATTRFVLEGLALLETLDTMPEDLGLTAYVFDLRGRRLGSAELEAKGRFVVPVQLERPADVQLLIGPAGKPETVLRSSVFKRTFLAKDWVMEGSTFHLTAKVFVGRDLWRLWRPATIFVSGHVRTTSGAPIPFVKVEIFDVDREGFLWPYLMRWTDLAKRKVLRIQDLLAHTELGPHPEPSDLQMEVMKPKLPVAETLAATRMELEAASFMEAVTINPQPEPPGKQMAATTSFVGEMAQASPAVIDKLEELTVTSRSPFWRLFPRSFYSKHLVDTVYTDHQGAFCASFMWWPFELRRGRLSFDYRPDIVVRVTQRIDGVETVLYMDPYSSTRWNVTRTHIDLWLDDPEMVPGSGETQTRPEASQTFFTRIGNDEVYDIDQTTGLYHGGAVSNMAYGHVLNLHAQFGDALSAGTPHRYYRMSYREGATGSFIPITTPLSDTRVDKATSLGETHSLGPMVVNGTTALYKVRDFNHYLWYNPDRVSVWDTRAMSTNSGLFSLRLEVFDQNGVPLAVDYLDGTVAPTDPPTPLPGVPHCKLVLAINNVHPEIRLQMPSAPTTGVVPWSPVLVLPIHTHVWQPDGRLWKWGLYAVKGLSATAVPLPVGAPVGGTFNAGIPSATANLTIPIASLGITESYALAFKLWAWAHVRNGYSQIYYTEKIHAVAVVKCPLEAA